MTARSPTNRPPDDSPTLPGAGNDATPPSTIALANRDRIKPIDFQVLLDDALPRALSLHVGDVCTAEYLVDASLWAATSDGVHRYFGRVISFMVQHGLLPLEPVGSGSGTRLYRRITWRGPATWTAGPAAIAKPAS